ncbi:ubiquitin-associated domain-containing protein 1 [Ostrinia furnacalis]|uniref:ubiquitin-associated domain-containing protein 1 n=1 Tax=Ostrinia furnacalis TaxID=93504 RepID=UPI0010408E62|nr:ubiquitin-associated domain-containing protein 1 [Ostrinia furnacalis]
MLVSDSGLNGPNELLVKVVSPDGQTFTAYFSEDTLIEEVKNRAIDYFYPTGETGASRYKIVRVFDTSTLHDFLTLAQEQVTMQEELLLVERRLPEAGTLWDLGAVRAPQQGTIAAATASLPAPQNTVRQPNLQSLLSTNELSYELRKILISLIEAGARLAAAGRNYEMTLAQLSAALDEPQRLRQNLVQVITPEEIAARFNPSDIQSVSEEGSSTTKTGAGEELFKRAEHLQRFLEKFRAWRMKIAEPPNPDAVTALKDLGFSLTDADQALRQTGCNVPAAASWLIGERGSSIFELINGLPDGLILQTLLKQPQIQRGLLNTRMLIAFIAMVGQTGSASLWLNSPHGSPLLSQISRTYHSEKYCLAVNQFSEERRERTRSASMPKVPGLYWSGGDVIYDNGFGCYAQRGRRAPIGAENYHFPHSMPGLLSMRVTRDDEMCGIFNITFKPLPQFDLHSVVFGRIIRPSPVFDSITSLGSALNSHPVVELCSTRRDIRTKSKR